MLIKLTQQFGNKIRKKQVSEFRKSLLEVSPARILNGVLPLKTAKILTKIIKKKTVYA